MNNFLIENSIKSKMKIFMEIKLGGHVLVLLESAQMSRIYGSEFVIFLDVVP
jgi:hypothetical protein